MVRKVWREQADRRQVDRPVRQQRQDDWKTSRYASGLDPSVGRVLREVQDLRAVGKERRAALAEVEPPFVQFGE
jgi:hypothetical protein